MNGASSGFSYDAAGNVLSDNVNAYIYDGEGRICAVKSEPVAGTYTMTQYLYDAEGTRVAKGFITNWGRRLQHCGKRLYANPTLTSLVHPTSS